jgi:uncharacterized protein (DUF697 family)
MGKKKKISIYEQLLKNKTIPEIPLEQQSGCAEIIHKAAVASGVAGAGMAQLVVADSAVITPIQIGMIIKLGGVFGKKITESAAKGILAGIAGAVVGRGVAQLLGGWIPVFGNVMNSATAVGVTETIGWLAAAHFYEEQELAEEDEQAETGNGIITPEQQNIIDRIEQFVSGELEYDENEVQSLLAKIEMIRKENVAEDSLWKELYNKLNEFYINH